jgi:hypothetical protein
LFVFGKYCVEAGDISGPVLLNQKLLLVTDRKNCLRSGNDSVNVKNIFHVLVDRLAELFELIVDKIVRSFFRAFHTCASPKRPAPAK